MNKAIAFAALGLAAASVFAHARLQGSVPADGSTVAVAPTELRLQYGEPVEAAMSTVAIAGPGGAALTGGPVAADKADARTLVVSLPKLPPGGYRVDWKTVGRDGHVTRGQIRFTVK
jgi:methionine-rich copper-binding protein CopC